MMLKNLSTVGSYKGRKLLVGNEFRILSEAFLEIFAQYKCIMFSLNKHIGVHLQDLLSLTSLIARNPSG